MLADILDHEEEHADDLRTLIETLTNTGAPAT